MRIRAAAKETHSKTEHTSGTGNWSLTKTRNPLMASSSLVGNFQVTMTVSAENGCVSRSLTARRAVGGRGKKYTCRKVRMLAAHSHDALSKFTAASCTVVYFKFDSETKNKKQNVFRYDSYCEQYIGRQES